MRQLVSGTEQQKHCTCWPCGETSADGRADSFELVLKCQYVYTRRREGLFNIGAVDKRKLQSSSFHSYPYASPLANKQ